jgi:trk system potassium uptake protein TrkA
VGATLAVMMANERHEVTVIDQNREAFERFGYDFGSRIKTVVGDGIDEDVLREAGLAGADAFCAVTNGDNRNIMAAQIAKYTFNVPNVLCRIYDQIRQATYEGLGLKSISPTIVGAKLMRDALLNPNLPASSVPHSLAAGTSVPITPLSTDAPRESERGASAATSNQRR